LIDAVSDCSSASVTTLTSVFDPPSTTLSRFAQIRGFLNVGSSLQGPVWMWAGRLSFPALSSVSVTVRSSLAPGTSRAVPDTPE
jgi:hypothetical protein